MPKALTTREVIQRLKAWDERIQVLTNRGKGSHIMLRHPSFEGSARSITCTNHKGKSVSRIVLKNIRRRFNLPRDFFD